MLSTIAKRGCPSGHLSFDCVIHSSASAFVSPSFIKVMRSRDRCRPLHRVGVIGLKRPQYDPSPLQWRIRGNPGHTPECAPHRPVDLSQGSRGLGMPSPRIGSALPRNQLPMSALAGAGQNSTAEPRRRGNPTKRRKGHRASAREGRRRLVPNDRFEHPRIPRASHQSSAERVTRQRSLAVR